MFVAQPSPRLTLTVSSVLLALSMVGFESAYQTAGLGLLVLGSVVTAVGLTQHWRTGGEF